MAIHSWCILASVLLVSVGADIYDQGPQTFFESSSPSPSFEQRPNKEFILYLTPEQAKTLEASGALVKPQPDLADKLPQNDEPQVTEEQEEPEVVDNSENEQNNDVDSELEEIFRILNQQKVTEEREEERREEEDRQQAEEITENRRVIPDRFSVNSKLNENVQEEKKNIAQSSPKKFGPAKSYSYVRFLRPSEESQYLNSKLFSAPSSFYYSGNNEQSANAGNQEEERPEEGTVSENQEENISTYVAPNLRGQNIATRIIQQRDRLLKNELELQSKLRELQDAPKHNDQKYAIEIERLRSNLEKQNALFKAEAEAKGVPILIKEEITVRPRRPVDVEKQVKAQAPRPVVVTVPSELKQPVPIVKTDNNEIEKPTPVKEEKRGPVTVTKNVYVKVNKPYLVEHFFPVELKKEIPVQVPIHKPEKLTVVRHVWEH